jgi:hypothetical protein
MAEAAADFDWLREMPPENLWVIMDQYQTDTTEAMRRKRRVWRIGDRIDLDPEGRVK